MLFEEEETTRMAHTPNISWGGNTTDTLVEKSAGPCRLPTLHDAILLLKHTLVFFWKILYPVYVCVCSISGIPVII
jgi:hypothetical protein